MTHDHDQDPDKHTWHDDTPFPQRWKSYTALKIAVLVLAVVLAVYLFGLL